MQNFSQQKQQISIALDQTTPLLCEECGSDIFVEVLRIRKIPKILIASQQDGLQPVSVFACAKCKHVNKEFDLKQA